MRTLIDFVRGAGLGLGLAAGCGPTVIVPGVDGSDDDGPGPMGTATSPSDSTSTGSVDATVAGSTGLTGEGPTGAPTTGIGDSSSADDEAGGFIPYDDLPTDGDCDLLTQDCPAGLKCMPWANDGGSSWNATGCFPIAEDPDGVNEPCTLTGEAGSGLDSCDLGLMCWDVDPRTNEGTCLAMCTGDNTNPICEDPETTCVVAADSAIILCIPTCDPLGDDCAPGEGCYNGYNEFFFCAPDSSGDMGQPGDPCEFINACDPGSGCISAELVPDCMGSYGCCSAFCDLDEGPANCLPGQDCVPWFEGDAPLGLDDVGMCALPS